MMTTVETGRCLGQLRTEFVRRDEAEGAGSLPRTDYRPERTPLLNDGRWYHWMLPGEDYDVRHDGVGWHVTCRTWAATGHTYRLATAGTWALAERLPVDDATVSLTPGRAYRLRSTGNGVWSVYEEDERA